MVLTVGFIDGFDHYPDNVAAGVTGGIRSVYNAFSGTNPVMELIEGLNGRGKALKFNAQEVFFPALMARVVPSTQQVSMTFAMLVDNLNTNVGESDEFLSFDDGLHNIQCRFKQQPTGRISLHGEGGTQVAVSDFPVQEGVVHRYGIALDINVGTCDFYIDGDLNKGFSVDSVDLIDAPANTDIQMQSWRLTPSNASTDEMLYTVDDVVYCYGAAQFLGELEVDTQPAGADVLKQWTPLTGVDNFAMIDDIPMDADVTYNHTDVVGNKDLFSFPGLPTSPETIFCLSLMAAARKEESGTRTFRTMIRQPTPLDTFGADENLSTDYQYFYSHFLQNPATLAAWLEAERAAASFGYDAVL